MNEGLINLFNGDTELASFTERELGLLADVSHYSTGPPLVFSYNLEISFFSFIYNSKIFIYPPKFFDNLFLFLYWPFLIFISYADFLIKM